MNSIESQVYGYVRVSSTDQNEDRQMIALAELNVPPAHIYRSLIQFAEEADEN